MAENHERGIVMDNSMPIIRVTISNGETRHTIKGNAFVGVAISNEGADEEGMSFGLQQVAVLPQSLEVAAIAVKKLLEMAKEITEMVEAGKFGELPTSELCDPERRSPCQH